MSLFDWSSVVAILAVVAVAVRMEMAFRSLMRAINNPDNARRLLTELTRAKEGFFYVTLPESLSEDVLQSAYEVASSVEEFTKSGEYKKFQMALAKMMKRYPHIPKRDLGLAIEVGVQWL